MFYSEGKYIYNLNFLKTIDRKKLMEFGVLFFTLIGLIQSQSNYGSIHQFGCSVPSTTPTDPDTSSFCDSDYECETGFYKMMLNEQTSSVNIIHN